MGSVGGALAPFPPPLFAQRCYKDVALLASLRALVSSRALASLRVVHANSLLLLAALVAHLLFASTAGCRTFSIQTRIRHHPTNPKLTPYTTPYHTIHHTLSHNASIYNRPGFSNSMHFRFTRLCFCLRFSHFRDIRDSVIAYCC